MATGLEGTYSSIKKLVEHLGNHPEDLISVASDGTRKKLQYEMIKTENKTYHLLLYDPETMNEFTDHETGLDGTFDTTPRIKEVKQILTIMRKKYNVVRINCLKKLIAVRKGP